MRGETNTLISSVESDGLTLSLSICRVWESELMYIPKLLRRIYPNMDDV